MLDQGDQLPGQRGVEPSATTGARAGVRPIGPTGAPVIGEPPLLVADLEALLEPAVDDEAAVLAVQRVHPALARDEVVAARALFLQQGDALAPFPRWGTALSLALLLGPGAQLVGQALVLGVAGLTSAGVPLLLDPQGGLLSSPGPIAMGAVVVTPLLSLLGFSLLQLEDRARIVLGALGAVGVLSALALAADGGVAEGAWVAATSALLLVALHPLVARWCTDEGRLAARLVSMRPYAAVVFALEGVRVSALLVAPPLLRAFKETGVDLPLGSRVAFGLCERIEDLALLWPLLPFAAVPLLRIGRRHERPAFLAALTFAVFALGSLAAALLLPLLELLDTL